MAIGDMLATELTNESWPPVPDWSALAAHASAAALARTRYAALGSSPKIVEIAIRLADDCEVKDLNRDHRGKDRPTNVLSFPMFEPDEISGLDISPMPEILLGDIVLARGVCETEAAEKGITLEAHVTHLVVHGLLHLLGYDHLEEGEAEAMEAIERLALSDLGYADPYGD
jgi:probable rRNA maturation factor